MLVNLRTNRYKCSANVTGLVNKMKRTLEDRQTSITPQRERAMAILPEMKIRPMIDDEVKRPRLTKIFRYCIRNSELINQIHILANTVQGLRKVFSK